LTDFVGSTDTNDYYRFSLASASNFNVSLTGLNADADVQLLAVMETSLHIQIVVVMAMNRLTALWQRVRTLFGSISTVAIPTTP
jgi:hypothetical protein